MSTSYGVNELREMFLKFFETKDHLRLPSFSLIPQNDQSLLIINSGMAPMKPYFKGEQEPPCHRICTCQKCIRTGDIENIGHTARHGTFFEMLGNFSFGDYFKHEAIAWSWEFLTSPKWVGLDPERLYPSVYQDDDEAFAIWRDEIGIPPERIFRFGKADNFWEHGAGPCGPCSEIYYDRGEQYGCGKDTCTVGCDCDRYIEVWNNVFSQFDNDGNNNYTELKQKNIDTGMGLERLAVVSQGVDSLFDVDTVMHITEKVMELTSTRYGQSKEGDVALRVITDHIRSAVFMISDGILPSNEGRGYVLRRLLRRAARYGKLLGVNEPFLYKVVRTVVDVNECQYGELREKESFIRSVIQSEEENFHKTLDKGLAVFQELKEATYGNVFSGADAFKLYDTYGFPIDLTKELCADVGLTVDEDGFRELMNQQRVRAREARKALGDLGWAGEEFGKEIPETAFDGYDLEMTQAKVLAIMKDSQPVQTLSEGEDGILVLDHTVLYAEMGGQVADHGLINRETSAFSVTNVQKNKGGKFMHYGHMNGGAISVGDEICVSVDENRRRAVSRAHTTTHLLHAVLRSVLGDAVHQAGSYVDEDTLRFDFTCNAALSADQLELIEFSVNKAILNFLPVTTEVMDLETAKKSGATALFGEKYAQSVRVVSVGDFSKELCGGTHLTNSAQAGSFRILSEQSVASGVRRIEAVTGMKTLQSCYDERSGWMAQNDELKEKIRKLNKEIDALKAKQSTDSAAGLLSSAQDVNGVHLLVTAVPMDGNAMRTLGDALRDKDPKVAAVLYGNGGACLCVCGRDSGLSAVELIRKIGKGGGKAESAMGKVEKTYTLDEIKELLV